MSFSVPRNVPNFDNPQRRFEDSQWGSSQRSRYATGTGGFGLSGHVGGKGLPMYKDKPYNYPASRRRSRWKLWALTCVAFIGVFYVFSHRGNRVLSRQNESTTGFWGSFSGIAKSGDWEGKRRQVVKAMELSWAGYERNAWGYDEYHPVAKSGRMMVPPTGLGWIIVDSLDTLMLMNLTHQLEHAREWISTTLTYNLDHDVNTFETTIRMLGGFLSAHYLQTAFPDLCPIDMRHGGEDLYLEKAVDLAERLLGAYTSPSGIPYASVNLKTRQGIPSHADGGSSSLAEATSLQLEMKFMANLTGEEAYWEASERVISMVDRAEGAKGLKPIFIHPDTGHFTSPNVRLGSRGDSFYEYLIKQYLQTSEAEDVYKDMWEEALEEIKTKLITYSFPSNFTVLAERPNGLEGDISPKMDHLVCFMPGTIALATTGGRTVKQLKKAGEWTPKREEDLRLAQELLKTCWGSYKYTATGLAPEITHFNLHYPPLMYEPRTYPPSPQVFDPSPDAGWRQDYYIKPADRHNLQRPETVESLFYLWRITEDPKYREWGWEMFQSFVEHTSVADGAGFSSIGDVEAVPPPTRDNMESFWPAETLKYFYLLFSPRDILPLDEVVFNTEAHPLPRFQMGKLFSTGWSRQRHETEGLFFRKIKVTETLQVTITSDFTAATAMAEAGATKLSQRPSWEG